MDFSYVATWPEMAVTVFLTEVYSHRFVGWRTTSRMPTDLPLDALEMVQWVREPAGQGIAGVAQHSDAGARYTSIRYSERLADMGAIASNETFGDPYDNALPETFVGFYMIECVRLGGLLCTADELEYAAPPRPHGFNESRLHSSNGYITPIEPHGLYYRESKAQRQPPPGQLTHH
ncbi:hypothetical protein LGT39_04945 [Demequina sp. TTPB684]|nr:MULTISPECIES: DDE-type integrase/transposase/recombinase [unclassified Demequina]MCB2412197.1 hypothetical protein [Demequina sp. TTPB684]UPU87329.1 hypothetical protein LGT36_008570 [Demequina sp. TMPB413]